MKRFRIEVPASTANLGPGFDTLGMALAIRDVVRVEIGEEPGEIVLTNAAAIEDGLDPHDNLLCRAYRLWGEDRECALPSARFTVESRIPVGKGFGSSAACIAAGLAAGAAASGEKQPQPRMIQLATAMEGHPDNAGAAIIGGIVAGFWDGNEARVLPVATHLSMGIALFVPRDPLPTVEARAILPQQIPLHDAVFNISRVAYLVTALLWGRWELISPAMEDRLHQPYRLRLIPALDDVIAAATAAGAYGAALSGGGPSVLALCPPERAEEIAAAMDACARERDWPGTSLVTSISHTGTTVTEEPPPP